MAFAAVSLQSLLILLSVSFVLNTSLSVIRKSDPKLIQRYHHTHDYMCVGCLALVLVEYFMKEQNESFAHGSLQERKCNNRGGWQSKTKQS